MDTRFGVCMVNIVSVFYNWETGRPYNNIRASAYPNQNSCSDQENMLWVYVLEAAP